MLTLGSYFKCEFPIKFNSYLSLLEPNAMKCVMKIRENYFMCQALGVGIVLETGARSQIFWCLSVGNHSLLLE